MSLKGINQKRFRRAMTRAPLAFGGALLLALSGCGTGDHSANADSGQAEQTLVDQAEESRAETDGRSPVFVALGIEEPDSQDLVEEEKATQACMIEKGFEYVLTDADDPWVSFDESQEKSYIDQWGFGISTTLFNQDAVGAELRGFRQEMHGAYVDPNAEIVDAMDWDQAQAYRAALMGQANADDATGSAADSGSRQGCRQVQGDLGKYAAVQQELEAEFDLMGQKMESDARFVELDQQIAECVAEAGFEYEDEGKFMLSYLAKTYADLGLAFDPDDYAPAPLDNGSLNDSDRATLKTLQDQEIAIAKAVYECGGFFEAYKSKLNEIIFEYEQELVDANKAVFDKYKNDQ